jgi:hypothetical protein
MCQKIRLSGLLFIIVLLADVTAFARGGVDSAALQAFVGKVRKAYMTSHLMDFRVRYYYANADQPQVHLDSLAGEIQMEKENSRLVLDGIETIVTGKYAIQINPVERSIYLAARRAGSTNPVGMVDSILAHIQGVEVSVAKQSHEEILTLGFPPDQPYSRIIIRIDAKTGLLQKVSYALNTSKLVSSEMIGGPGNSSPYQAHGNMDILFSDYRQGKFDDNLFREENFITRVAPGQFEPAGRYKDYHIYLASSNL